MLEYIRILWEGVIADGDLLINCDILGTLDNPIVVRSFGDEQFAGCTGYPADSHWVKWLKVRFSVYALVSLFLSYMFCLNRLRRL